MYLRLSIQGTLGSFEKWSVNPTYDPQGEVENSWNQENGDAMAAAAGAVTMPTSLRTLLSGAGAWTGVRLEGRHNSTDELLGFSEFVKSTPVFGTGSTVFPLQTAVVTSLRTSTPGASGRGRLYWPAIGATLNGSFRLSAPSPSSVAADTKTFLSALGAAMLAALAPTPPWTSVHLAVRSKTNHATPHVTSIQVGDIVDTQRRRRDSIPEGYTAVTYP